MPTNFREYSKFCVFPEQPIVLARNFQLIHRDFPRLSTCYPQEIFCRKRFFVVPGNALSEFVPTATKREQRGGTRRPKGWKRKVKGHEPGAERGRFERGCEIEGDSRSSLKGSSFRGRCGLRKIFGSTVTATSLRARSKWARRPLGGKVHRRRQDVPQGTMRRPRLSTWRLHLFCPPGTKRGSSPMATNPVCVSDAVPRLRTCAATDTHVIARDQPDVGACDNDFTRCVVAP